jgi:sarcosine oxidase subunit gamma
MAENAARNTPPVPGKSWLKPLPPAMRLILHGDAAVRVLAAAAWRVPFAEEACRACVSGGRATLWMGPDEYLLIDSAAEAPAQLERVIGTLPHALVDVSHRQLAFEVHGLYAEEILNGGCPLDLDLVAFPIGMCTRTLCGKADIVLWRTGAYAFHVEVWRSFSDYLLALLTEIARDVVP